MNGLLFIGGAGPGRDLISDCIQDAGLIAAADSGLDRALAVGVEPDLVVGDMDSLSDTSLLDKYPADRVALFPRDKDETDTEIGLRILRERGCDQITIVGGGGGRLDHLLGVFSLFERDNPPSRWITDGEDVRLVTGRAEFRGWKGCTVSVFPIGPLAGDMGSEGFQWPLEGLSFARGYAGISNRVVGDVVRLSVGIGRLLVIRLLRED